MKADSLQQACLFLCYHLPSYKIENSSAQKSFHKKLFSKDTNSFLSSKISSVLPAFTKIGRGVEGGKNCCKLRSSGYKKSPQDLVLLIEPNLSCWLSVKSINPFSACVLMGTWHTIPQGCEPQPCKTRWENELSLWRYAKFCKRTENNHTKTSLHQLSYGVHQTNKKVLAKRPEEHAVEPLHSPVEVQSTPVPAQGELEIPLGPSKPL